MKKLMAVVAFAALAVASVAVARTVTDQGVDEARVQAQIDARLHQMLLKVQRERQ